MTVPSEAEKRRVGGYAKATDLAALQLDVDGLVTDVTTLLARLTALRAGYLDELAAANMPAILDDTYAEIEVVERHLHGNTKAFGISADQSGNNWGLRTGLLPYRVISGNGDFGSDAGDEAKVLGTDDTPVETGMTFFDSGRLLVKASSNSNVWILRFIYGTGTLADAITAGQFTEEMATDLRKGGTVRFQSKRVAAGSKVWVDGKNGSNNATLDFFMLLHEYPE
jgi:hypothetical protein